jgi:hypothetical protein
MLRLLYLVKINMDIGTDYIAYGDMRLGYEWPV